MLEGLISLVRRVPTITKLNPAQSAIRNSQSGNAYPTDITDYTTAYEEIEIIHRAVEIIINACEEIPFKVAGTGAIKKISKLLNSRPNPFETRTAFFRRALLDYILDGNAFFYYDKKHFYILPANEVEIVPDSITFVSKYIYSISTADAYSFAFGVPVQRRKKSEKESIEFTPDEIIHVKADNSESIYRGSSKLKSLDRIIKVYYALIGFQKQFFENNAVPGLVLRTDQTLSKKIKDRVLESWISNYNSLFNGARSPAILDGGLQIDKFSNINFQELDYENSIDRLQQDMAKAIGVPYVLLKSGNNANIGANQILFYNHTILPILREFSSAFQQFFGEDIDIVPDHLSVTALRPDKKVQASFWATLVNSGIATVNEAREDLRLPSRLEEEHDNIRIPQNIAGSAVNPSMGGRPEGKEEEDNEENT